MAGSHAPGPLGRFEASITYGIVPSGIIKSRNLTDKTELKKAMRGMTKDQIIDIVLKINSEMPPARKLIASLVSPESIDWAGIYSSCMNAVEERAANRLSKGWIGVIDGDAISKFLSYHPSQELEAKFYRESVLFILKYAASMRKSWDTMKIDGVLWYLGEVIKRLGKMKAYTP